MGLSRQIIISISEKKNRCTDIEGGGALFIPQPQFEYYHF